MPTDPRIDAYIAKAAPFAQPILTHLRALVHRALPEAEETIKWGMPHFTVRGKNVSGFAAFKAHCAFVIHGDGRQGEPEGEGAKEQGMGGYGKIGSLADLPPDGELEGKVRAAAERVAASGSALKPTAKKPPKAEIPMPDDFAAALAAVPKAQATLAGFAPGQRLDYLEWITQARQPATREKRIAQAVDWLAEGKKRNWKYENC